ncbi:MAG: nucleotide exchange factor GrpE, partial [Methylicorpusculum sp.]|nr:nucleotide exchange factor GrpE [Methylicorpusculum sp.]
MSNEKELPEAAKEEELKIEAEVTPEIQETPTEEVPVPQSEVQEDLSAELQKKLEQAEQKAAENWDRAMRLQAEMENLKKRIQKDLESAHKYALESFAKELLAVLDSLELGLQAASGESSEVQKFREGSELTIK